MSRKQNVLKEEVITEIGADRRRRRRYDIDLDLQYKVLRQNQVCQSGVGKTVNLSAGGIAVAIDNVLSPGSVIELAVAWPLPLNKTCSLQLVITGKVVRSGDTMTAVRMQHHEFRAQGMQARAVGYPA